jgi:uncharacterized protein involved in exopolysaccharide biosynthesis
MEKDLSRIDNLLSRDAKIEEAKSMPTIQVLDWAIAPEKKCKPRRTQMVLLAGITGLFVSVFAAFVRERFTRASFGGMKG